MSSSRNWTYGLWQIYMYLILPQYWALKLNVMSQVGSLRCKPKRKKQNKTASAQTLRAWAAVRIQAKWSRKQTEDIRLQTWLGTSQSSLPPCLSRYLCPKCLHLLPLSHACFRHITQDPKSSEKKYSCSILGQLPAPQWWAGGRLLDLLSHQDCTRGQEILKQKVGSC